MAFTFLTSLVLTSFIAAVYYSGYNIDIIRSNDRHEDETQYYISKPLFLTPLIKNGSIDDARRLSIIEYEGLREVISYSGFFTINKEYHSNLFFWFFPAEISSNTAPLIIWLQGNPGESSLLGLFTENGPFYLSKDHRLYRRRTSWSEPFNVLYIDSPIGAGFSFTDREEGYADNQLSVGLHLYQAVKEFFQLFPELRLNDLYIATEAFGVNFATALGYVIHASNPVTTETMNFKGLLIFDGHLDPVREEPQSDDSNEDAEGDNRARRTANVMSFNDIRKAIAYERQIESFINHPSSTTLGDIRSMVTEAMSFVTSLIYTNQESNDQLEETDVDILTQFLDAEGIKYAIHAGNRSFIADSSAVKYYLDEDMSVSLGNVFAILLQNYKILIANGELNIAASVESIEESLMKLNWNLKNLFRIAPGKPYLVDSQIAGYVKNVGNLMQVVVKDAKESVIKEHPIWILDLITEFMKDHETSAVSYGSS